MMLFILGCFLGYFISYCIRKFSNKELSKRRGIVIRNYTSATDAFDVQYEIEELDSSDKKTKVKVLNCTPTKTPYLTPYYKKVLKEMVDESWINTKDIDWVVSKTMLRDQKISSILENK